MYRMSRKNTAVDCCYSRSTAVFLLEHPVCIDLLLPWMSKLWVAFCAKLFLQCDAWLWPGAIARYCKPTWLNLKKVVVAVKWGFMLISFSRVVVMEKMLQCCFTYFQPNLCLYPVHWCCNGWETAKKIFSYEGNSWDGKRKSRTYWHLLNPWSVVRE